MIKLFKKILQIIPDKFQKKSFRYSLFSILNVFLDLLSIAYLIPLFIFILDKAQMPVFLKKISFFNESQIGFWVSGIIVFFILKNYLQIVIIKFQSNLVFEIATNLSSGLTKQFLQRPYSHIQQMDKGKEIQKIQLSGTDFANHILLSVNTLFTEVVVISIIAVVSVVLYPKFSIIIFLISIACLFLLYRIRKKKIQKISNSIRDSYSTSTSDLLNIIDGFLEIKSLGKESFFQKKFEAAVAVFNANFAVLKKHQNSNGKYLEIFIILGLSLFLYFINTSYDIPSQKIILISFVAGISLKLFPSLNKIIIAVTNFKSYSYTLEVFSEKKSEPSPEKETLPFLESVSLNNINFSYSNKNKLLTAINLNINRGEIIGIKGRSGVGKTTLLNIIMGLIEPDSGALFLDNSKVEKHSVLFNFIGYVPQQPFLFQGSLLDNIVMGENPDKIDFNRIEMLIDSFNLSNFIAQLPKGLHTKISHNSLSVSGGQKQRIALIRALYASPQLLILDEVTNQLDEELEEKVLQFLHRYSKEYNIAIVLVSHALIISNVCSQTYKISNHTLKKI